MYHKMYENILGN